MRTLRHWLARRAETVLVLMMAAMFIAFILQIVFRYFLNLPVAGTEEVCAIAWLWGILWGASFVTGDREDIRFDMVYNLAPRRVRRVLTIVSSVAIVVILLVSLPAAFSYVSFMKVETSASLSIRLDWLFSIYLVFAVAMVVRQGRIAHRAWRGRLVEDPPAQA